MSHKYHGGCDHIHTHSNHDPIDNHTCHCSVCKSVTGQPTTHVVFFNHDDVKVSNEAGLKRQPFNAANPDGPLELCTCGDCGTPIMLDDKMKRIRVIVPNLMGYDAGFPAASYHAFYDPATNVQNRMTDARCMRPSGPISPGRTRPDLRGRHSAARLLSGIQRRNLMRQDAERGTPAALKNQA